MNDKNEFVVAIGAAALGISIASWITWFTIRGERLAKAQMEENPTRLVVVSVRQRPTPSLDHVLLVEKMNILETKLTRIEDLLENDQYFKYISSMNYEKYQTINIQQQRQEQHLKQFELRLSILEDELQKRIKMNVFFDKMANLILLFDEKQEQHEAELNKYKTSKCSAGIPPPRPPLPVAGPPPSPRLSLDTPKQTNSKVDQSFGKIKISVEDLKNVNLKPVLKTLSSSLIGRIR